MRACCLSFKGCRDDLIEYLILSMPKKLSRKELGALNIS